MAADDVTTDEPSAATGRLELDPASVERGVYPWLTASLIPRAIAWVSTVSAAGVDNVAPHSFTTVAGVDPPTLCFTSVGAKDTLANTRATGEFVLNIGSAEISVVGVTGGIGEALIATACGLGIAIFSLVPFNYFSAKVAQLQFDLETAATNVEVMVGGGAKTGDTVHLHKPEAPGQATSH